ncbi:hypothetical protein CCP2SC5_170036 [Azospirillaceae bacterium]
MSRSMSNVFYFPADKNIHIQLLNLTGPGTVFLVARDHKGGAKAPLIRGAIFFWNRWLFFAANSLYTMIYNDIQ